MHWHNSLKRCRINLLTDRQIYNTVIKTLPPIRVWLKSPPTPPTIISNPYQLNKQLKQLGEFINIKWMFTHVWTSFEWSLKLKCKLWRTRQPTLIRLWPVRATNYGRWWLQSNRSYISLAKAINGNKHYLSAYIISLIVLAVQQWTGLGFCRQKPVSATHEV